LVCPDLLRFTQYWLSATATVGCSKRPEKLTRGL